MSFLQQIAPARSQFVDANGAPLVGGTVTTYVPGTTTPATTYQDPNSAAQNTNPITLDSIGSAAIWYDGLLRMVVKDVNGNQIYDQVAGDSGAPYLINTFAAATSNYIPASVNLVQAAGYNAAGDGSYPKYRYDAAVDSAFVAANPRISFISANGRGFRLAIDGWVNSKWFGALGGSADVAFSTGYASLPNDAPALQACMDYCIANRLVMYTPAGGYKVDTPLTAWVWDGSNFSFMSFQWYGDGRGHDGGALSTTIIRSSFGNCFIFAIQGGRACHIKDIQFMGQNVFPVVTQDMICIDGTYINNGVRDNQYSPHAAVAIDPIGTSSLVVAGDRYPGFSSYYKASLPLLTADSLFENVGMSYTTVNCMLTAGGVDGQTSETTFFKCHFSFGKVGYATGATQADTTLIFASSMYTLRTCIDGLTYGVKNGRPPQVIGLNAGYFKHMLNVPLSLSQGIKMQDIHTESCGGIGYIGASNASGLDGVCFRNCHFNMGGTGGIYPDFFMVSYTSVNFDNCYIESTTNPQPPYRMWTDSGKYITYINGTQISGNNNFGLPYGGQLVTTSTTDESWRHRMSSAMVINTGNPANGNCQMSDRLAVPFEFILDRYYVQSGGIIQTVNGDTPTKWRCVPQGVQQVSLGLVALTVTVASQTATFPCTDMSIIRIGDQVSCTDTFNNWENNNGSLNFSAKNVCYGVVTAVSAATGSGTVTLSCIPQNLTNGNYNLVVSWWALYHRPSTGDITSASNQILNVSPIGTWIVGNRLQTAAGSVAPGTYITAISGTTVTISKPATDTTPSAVLYDAVINSITLT